MCIRDRSKTMCTKLKIISIIIPDIIFIKHDIYRFDLLKEFLNEKCTRCSSTVSYTHLGKLTFDERARWIVTSNFAEIWIYDMNQKQPEPTKIALDAVSYTHLEH